MAFWAWSRTAASNATADSTINWQEGQAPSTINDSARALMARVAEYRDDVAGGLSTAGTSTAYTVTTNEVFDSFAHMNAQKITILIHATNGAAPTLNVDGLGAKPIHSAIGIAVTTGMLIANTPYDVVYSSANNCFVVFGIIDVLSLVRGTLYAPAGTLMLFQQTSAPTGWTKQTTHNDKALRVVSGTASSGGTSAFSTVFGLTATGGYTIILSDLPGSLQASGGASAGPTVTSPNIFTAPVSSIGVSGQAHAHPIELRVQYVDLIIASKD